MSDASRVILRGFTRGAQEHAIWLKSGNDIVIENCDISGRGTPSPNG